MNANAVPVMRRGVMHLRPRPRQAMLAAEGNDLAALHGLVEISDTRLRVGCATRRESWVGARARRPRPAVQALHWNALVLLALATLGACARPDQDRPEAAGQLSAQWLVGGWVLKGSACQSDGGVIYRADGSWYADGASGTWRIERGGLVYLIREQEDELGRRVRNDPPVRHVERIQIVNANEYVASRPDGVVRRLVRCGS